MVEDPLLFDDWHVVAYAEDLPEGQPVSVKLLGEDMVLWRVGERVHAWRDLCIHRGAKLSLGRVEEGTLVCPYHGWTYDEEGRCVRFPAHPEQSPPSTARAVRYNVRQRYGWIWVAARNPQRDVAEFEQWGDDSYRKVHCGPYEVEASGPRLIENFLDVAHFPFVHEGLLGDPAHTEVSDYTAEIGPDGVTARDITIWQPDPDGTGQGARVTYVYRVPRPLTASFLKTSGGSRFAMYFTVTPVTGYRSLIWMYVAMDYGTLSDEQVRRFQEEILEQDILVVESQRPELLPLDLQAELHLRSDRTAIAYRKWLGQLGVKLGTS
ncbi:MAG: aromatic ring-hydroxylating dioxygenase subunit alpha [Candidatus Dormibacteraeota bacterium]|nr:aromatic ring-hydroxylating dioxygenase subunit alpha [Candidatus Dormibacteraeota bacterium]